MTVTRVSGNATTKYTHRKGEAVGEDDSFPSPLAPQLNISMLKKVATKVGGR